MYPHIRSNQEKVMRFFSIVYLAATALCFAQDVVVKGNSTQEDVFSSTNTSSSAQDRIGAHGISIPTPYWGIGLQGDGGLLGFRVRLIVLE
jgi:hypothetical protein